MSFHVDLTERAYADLDRLIEWWPEGAGRITEAFFAALPRLEQRPLSCGIAFESRFFAVEIRHLLFEVRRGRRCRALFAVEGDRVRVLAIRAPGERPLKPRDLKG